MDSHAPKHRLWDESADYYTKTLAGGPVDERGVGVDVSRFARARGILDRFDLVLVFEGFGIPGYDASWARRLNLDPGTTMPAKRQTTETQDQYDIRRHFSEELQRKIMARNYWDTELYRHARSRFPVPLPAPPKGVG